MREIYELKVNKKRIEIEKRKSESKFMTANQLCKITFVLKRKQNKAKDIF
ncbi:hypothetical protein AGMMS49593_01830 [Endomicrobiia bacterium]|nr:hypothetical protein AGMMS49593_01830 [Endomicrobiia bacterium]